MKEAVLLGSWTNTPEREQTLIDTILKWKKYDMPIIVGTHWPLSRRIQNMIDYYVFDSEQYLDPRVTMFHWFGWGEVKIVAPFDKPFHGPAAIIALENALRVVDKKYDFIYFQDYDVELNIEKTLNHVRQIRTPEKSLYIFPWSKNGEYQENAYVTSVCFFYRGGFSTLWKGIQSVDDYLDLIKISEKDNVIIEVLAKDLIDKQNLNIHLFDLETSNELILTLNEHSSEPKITDPKIYLSSTTDGGAILFLVNELDIPIEIRIQTENLVTEQQSDILQSVKENIGLSWMVFDNNTRLKVSYNNIEKEYYINQNNIFNECRFEFFDGTPIYKK